MTNGIQWQAIEHSGSNCLGEGKHVIAVGYRSRGKGGLNEVCSVIPLYDIRDSNLNGSVSFLEGGWNAGTAVVDPLHIFQIMNSLGEVSFMAEAAVQMDDGELLMEVKRSALERIYKARHEILMAVLMKTFLTANINLNVDLFNKGLAEISRFGFHTAFFVKVAVEQAVMASIKPMLRA